MSAPVPIPVYPWPLDDARLEILKAAKASLDTDVKIIPVEAVYGSPNRVLSFGKRPWWFCKWAPVRPENVDNVASVAAALNFILEEAVPDARWDETAWLSDAFGVQVTLRAVEPFHSVAFA